MADPVNFGQAWEKLAAEAHVLYETWKFGAINEPNYVELERVRNGTARLDENVEKFNAAIKANRNSLNAILEKPSKTLNFLIEQIARSPEVNSPAKTTQGQWDDIFDYMHDNSESVKSRGFTFNAFVAGLPYNGTDGVWRRVTKDDRGYDIESAFPDTYTLRCEKDQTLGADFKGREVFSIKGLPYFDAVSWSKSGTGSGIESTVTGINADASLLQNSSWGDAVSGGDSTPSAIPGWTATTAIVGDGSDFRIDRTTANIYQANKSEGTTPGVLQWRATNTLTQQLRGAGTKNISVDVKKPYHASVEWNGAQGSAVGIAVLTLGSKTATVVVCGAPIVAALGGAGNVTAGSHSWYVTFVYGGVETGYSPTSNVITSVGSQVNLTVPVGPAGTTARKIYQKVAGNTGNPKLLTTISDNTTTAYVADTADGSLGAEVTTTSHAGWLRLQLGETDQKEQYPRNWNTTNAGFAITFTKTSGYWVTDRALLVPYQEVKCPRTGGIMHWLAPISGQTPWLYRDTGTITDECTGSDDTTDRTGILNDVLHRAIGRHAPHSSTPTIPDPTWSS